MSASISTTARPAAPTQGRLLLPGLRPYESNRVRVEVDDLPLDAEIATAEVEAVPFERSGMTIAFPLAQAEQATAVLHDADGQPLPVGLRLRSADGAVTAWVARDGFSQVAGRCAAATRVDERGRRSGLACELPPAAADELLPDLGVGRMSLIAPLGLVLPCSPAGAGPALAACSVDVEPVAFGVDRPAAPEPGYRRGRGPLRQAGELHGRHLAGRRRRRARRMRGSPAAGSTTTCSPSRATRFPGATARPRQPGHRLVRRRGAQRGSPIYGIVPPQAGIDAGEYDDSLEVTLTF